MEAIKCKLHMWFTPREPPIKVSKQKKKKWVEVSITVAFKQNPVNTNPLPFQRSLKSYCETFPFGPNSLSKVPPIPQSISDNARDETNPTSSKTLNCSTLVLASWVGFQNFLTFCTSLKTLIQRAHCEILKCIETISLIT